MMNDKLVKGTRDNGAQEHKEQGHIAWFEIEMF